METEREDDYINTYERSLWDVFHEEFRPIGSFSELLMDLSNSETSGRETLEGIENVFRAMVKNFERNMETMFEKVYQEVGHVWITQASCGNQQHKHETVLSIRIKTRAEIEQVKLDLNLPD